MRGHPTSLRIWRQAFATTAATATSAAGALATPIDDVDSAVRATFTGPAAAARADGCGGTRRVSALLAGVAGLRAAAEADRLGA
jgi:hypothetical protein